MTTSERINKIAERREMLDAQQRAMESGKAMTIANLEKGIKSLAPRIKELIAVGEALLRNNIPFGKVSGFWNDEEFITNGITHQLGFYFKYNKNNSPLLGIGIKGGGCCGHDLAVNANGEFVINIDPYEKVYEYNGYNDYCHKYEQFIEEFHGFENRVYQYVENL